MEDRQIKKDLKKLGYRIDREWDTQILEIKIHHFSLVLRGMMIHFSVGRRTSGRETYIITGFVQNRNTEDTIYEGYTYEDAIGKLGELV